MKNELKVLYKKNPKLALQVAKVLGLKIKVKAQDEGESEETPELGTKVKKIHVIYSPERITFQLPRNVIPPAYLTWIERALRAKSFGVDKEAGALNIIF